MPQSQAGGESSLGRMTRREEMGWDRQGILWLALMTSEMLPSHLQPSRCFLQGFWKWGGQAVLGRQEEAEDMELSHFLRSLGLLALTRVCLCGRTPGLDYVSFGYMPALLLPPTQ